VSCVTPSFVDENQREGGYYNDYGFLRTTVGVTFTFGGN
jgi:hypothetical protein